MAPPKNSTVQQTKQHQQQQQMKALATGRCLEALVIERLALPEQVVEYNQFEELSKLYEIEQPFVPRTQIELLFDVYDGVKLRPGCGSMDDDCGQQQQQQTDSDGEPQQVNQYNASEPTSGNKSSKLSIAAASAGLRRSSFAGQGKRRASSMSRPSAKPVATASQMKTRSGLSWSRLLFAKRNKGLVCCLKPSDTNQELGLLSVSSSANSIGQLGASKSATSSGDLVSAQQQQQQSPLIAAACATLAPSAADDHESRELKLEAIKLIESALGSASGRPSQSIDLSQLAGMDSAGGGLGPALALESAQMEATGGCVSVCLLDKRLCQSKTIADLMGLGAGECGGGGAQNGRIWARASARLVELRHRLRNSTSAKLSAAAAAATASLSSGTSGHKKTKQLKSGDNHRILVKQMERIARKASRKFWSELPDNWDKRATKATNDRAVKSSIEPAESNDGDSVGGGPSGSSGRSKKLDAEQMEQLVDSVKNSLNQLIDAQLLLRNKLTIGLDQTSSILAHQVRSAEYETLLRNNFNLLKIWQNLEETKRLVCFVCEPIKANLADLFAFNRQRLDWAPASAFESVALNCNTTPTANENGTSAKCHLLVSPLVSLDAVQLKRGLIQILEALNFLHAICKLIHRNLTPKNILICQNDNWKLSGLEFAIRFESTTISESASMMAHEFSQSLGPMIASGAGTGGDGRISSGAIIGSATSTSGHLTNSTAQLRRQRTLHQTKCEEFVKWPKCLLLQPDLNYLAPEILRSSKCSHKSDLFSYGLILGQTYDLCRHKAPLSCRLSAQNYEQELKKLDERRKIKLAQLVPSEMRTILLEMLDSEPNLRPSANRVLQILKRPIGLCKSNEDSLKHLKSSLGYLDARLACPTSSNCVSASLSGGGGGGPESGLTMGNNRPADNYHGTTNGGASGGGAAPVIGGGGGAAAAASGGAGVNLQQRSRRPANYFRRVTSAAANREPAGRRLTRNLQLLNHLVRAVDSMASASVQSQQSPPPNLASGGGHLEFFVTEHGQQAAIGGGGAGAGGRLSSRRQSFCSLRIQFEQTLETLKQVLKWTMTAPGGLLAHQAAGWPTTSSSNPLIRRAEPLACPSDSRSLLLIVALHRRLLDQVTAMRAELPPICRLIGPSSGSNQPLDRSLASANHRALADIEERFHSIISKQSIGQLGEALADPLLKLDEFLLVFELVNDLVCFVGQKCKLNYAQRGKQLLNQLTPITGCPSLSSSEEEDDDSLDFGIPDDVYSFNQGSSFGGSNLALAASSNGGPSPRCRSISAATSNTTVIMNNRMGQQQQQQDRFQMHDHYQQRYDKSSATSLNNQHQESSSSLTSSRPPSRQQQQQPQHHLYNYPTSINITAPSPMGSVRDMSRASLASSTTDSTIDGHKFQTVGANRASVQFNRQLPQVASINNKRHSHQDVSAVAMGSNDHQSTDYQLADRTSQMSLSNQVGGYASQQESNNMSTNKQIAANRYDASAIESDRDQSTPQEDDKSRSKLIDELLKTINDDSFNDFIDFNNRLSATAKAGGQDSEMDLANANRPKSAIGLGSPLDTGAGGQLRGQTSMSPGPSTNQQQLHSDASTRPRTLNLGSAAATNQAAPTSGQLHHHQRYQTRGSICAPSGGSSNQSSSTFDNVIRRMSTNIVQNFNKMSGTNLGNQTSAAGQLSDNYQHQHLLDTSSSSTNLRREKSSTSTYTANSLYVDNQVPARRHSDNTINVPRIQVALSSPQPAGSRATLNMRAGVSATKLANKWKLTAKSNQREASDKLSPNLGGALGYIRRHSSGNTKGEAANNSSEQNQSNGLGAGLLNMSPFKQQTRSSSNLGIDFLTSNRSMKRRCSAASMLGHQTQRKAEDLIDAGMKSVDSRSGIVSSIAVDVPTKSYGKKLGPQH